MQTDYSLTPAVGFAGMRADTGRHNEHVMTFVNPSVIIPFGCAVTTGTDDDHVKLPTSAAEVTAARGIALADFAVENANDSALPNYPVKSSVNVLRQGRCYVTVEENVARGDNCYVRWADGNSGKVQKGAFRKSVDQVSSADTATLLPNAKYLTTTAAGGLAIVEINSP